MVQWPFFFFFLFGRSMWSVEHLKSLCDALSGLNIASDVSVVNRSNRISWKPRFVALSPGLVGLFLMKDRGTSVLMRLVVGGWWRLWPWLRCGMEDVYGAVDLYWICGREPHLPSFRKKKHVTICGSLCVVSLWSGIRNVEYWIVRSPVQGFSSLTTLCRNFRRLQQIALFDQI